MQQPELWERLGVVVIFWFVLSDPLQAECHYKHAEVFPQSHIVYRFNGAKWNVCVVSEAVISLR